MRTESLRECRLCPRSCGVDRTAGETGFCGCTDKVRIARADLHHWEEPCLSGTKGAGTVFFSGCSLKCCFCQNYEISAENKGFELTVQELADTFLMLQDKGAHNIDLVTPTPYVSQIKDAIDLVRDRLHIPVVYNCGGYESVSTIKSLKGYVDIFLPDLKYYSSELSDKFSSAPDYFEKASEAIKEMVTVAGRPVFDDQGILQSGVVVRHLVLPGCRKDSQKVIGWLADEFSPLEILLSLMSQYTPCYKAKDIKELSRRTSTFEYESICQLVTVCGFNGYFQQRTAAKEEYIPEFYEKKYY